MECSIDPVSASAKWHRVICVCQRKRCGLDPVTLKTPSFPSIDIISGIFEWLWLYTQSSVISTLRDFDVSFRLLNEAFHVRMLAQKICERFWSVCSVHCVDNNYLCFSSTSSTMERHTRPIVDYRLSIFDSIGDVRFSITDCRSVIRCRLPIVEPHAHQVYMFRANREFAQTQDCPAQTRNSNFAAQSWDCADRRSEDLSSDATYAASSPQMQPRLVTLTKQKPVTRVYQGISTGNSRCSTESLCTWTTSWHS